MSVNKKIEYTPEQFENTEKMAKLLTSMPKEKENIFVTMTNVFISGMKAGVQLSKEKSE